VRFEFRASAELAGRRLDQAVAEMRPELSRAQVRRLLEEGAVTVDGRGARPSHRLREGEHVRGRVPEPEPDTLIPEAIPIDVAFEDEHLIVVDKPAGLVVHPAAGHRTGTLVHALLHHCRELSGVGGVRRPGIVHRLDKDTSGLLVCAKNDLAHRALAEQFRVKSVDREYLALVRGSPRADSGSIEAPIARSRSDRKKFTTRARGGRSATTHWSVVQRLVGHCLLRVRLETGRTHQIRVHLASVGLPVAGDPVYGGGRAPARALGLDRQALHAALLGFEHPDTGERVAFRSELPEDLAVVFERLRG
jgi:23S rRNA pseudouridine1911/1915/1917 synthase